MTGAPAALASARVAYAPPPRGTNRLAKSAPPSARPIGGIRTSSTRELTILPKAVPRITATARSITLPRATNSLNSRSSDMAILQSGTNQHLEGFAPHHSAQPLLELGQRPLRGDQRLWVDGAGAQALERRRVVGRRVVVGAHRGELLVV